ncbi:hypothetical protein HED51_19420 [Ochrobactrum grignonense]|nr:hypothetical protein [Brucella grignonensis]NKB84402.1 hypothetical protein [Brucella grignonensis]
MLDLPDAILDTLPEASRMKLERHLADRDASFAAYRQASDREQSARAEYGLVGGFAASRLKAHPGSQTTYPGAPDPKPTATTQERISAPVEAAKRALQVASAARERAGEHQDKFAFLENILEWLRRTAAPGGHFREARIDPALVKTKGPLLQKLRKSALASLRLKRPSPRLNGHRFRPMISEAVLLLRSIGLRKPAFSKSILQTVPARRSALLKNSLSRWWVKIR